MRTLDENAQARFIEKAEKKHNGKYDYSKVKYISCKKKVCIICPQHGEFWQSPDNHIQGRGCPVCRYESVSEKNSSTKEEFIARAVKIHGDKYDYSKVQYKNNTTPVCIICPEHGEYWQVPSIHTDNKAGCPKCSRNYRYKTEEFIESLEPWIKEKYDFSKFIYVRTHDKATVICPKHGEFLMSPHNIRKGIGCPRCKESKLEINMRNFLEKEQIKYIYEYKPDKSFHKQSIDFYLFDYNIAIECQGSQHFRPADFGGKGNEWAESAYQHIIDLDKEKQRLCREKDIQLVYYLRKEDLPLLKNNTQYNDCILFTNLTDIKDFLHKIRTNS